MAKALRKRDRESVRILAIKAAHSVKMKLNKALFVFAILQIFFPFVSAVSDGWSDFGNPLTYIYFTIAWTIIVLIISAKFKEKVPKGVKKLFFFLLVIPIVLSSLYLGGSTINENVVSETNGPVHWHADYEVWVCGEKLDLIDPKFPSNKIGSPLFHEHNDDRIHIEGTVVNLQNVDLGSYFEVIGGDLKSDYIKYPTTEGVAEKDNGDLCDGVPGNLKVYVNGKKIQDFENYKVYPEARVPPGDCIIVEFSESNEDTTSRICNSWNVLGWDYASFERNEKTLGDKKWR